MVPAISQKWILYYLCVPTKINWSMANSELDFMQSSKISPQRVAGLSSLRSLKKGVTYEPSFFLPEFIILIALSLENKCQPHIFNAGKNRLIIFTRGLRSLSAI